MKEKVEISRDISKDRQMDFDEIIDIIKKSKINGNSNCIEMYFVKKTRSGYYYFFNAGMDKKVISKIKEISIGTANDMKTLNQIEYDSYKNKGKGNLEIVDLDFINKSWAQYIECKNDTKYKIEEFDPTEIQHYFFHFKYNDKSVYVFRRFTKMTDLRKGAFGIFNDGSFEILDNKNKIVGLHSDIDMFIYDNQVSINMHSVLENIFDISHEFRSNAEDILKEISKKPEFKAKIDNFEQFSKDVLENKDATKRLTNVKYNKHRMKNFFTEFERTQKVDELFKLDLTFNDDKIIYQGKKDVGPITMLMNDAFYKTLMGEEPGITE